MSILGVPRYRGTLSEPQSSLLRFPAPSVCPALPCTAKCGSTGGRHGTVTALPKGDLRSAEGGGVPSTFGILRRAGTEGFQWLTVTEVQEAVAVPWEHAGLADGLPDVVVICARRSPVGPNSTQARPVRCHW